MAAVERRPTFDLQSHSTCSDGVLAPSAVVEHAARAGIELLALSDHDTIDGQNEALGAAQRCGIRVVTSVEISAVHAERGDLHVLGYGVDHHAEVLLTALADYRADRELRAQRMAAALESEGWVLDRRAMDARVAAGKPVGRPHLAGAVVAHPANAGRMAEQGLSDLTDVLVAYLIPGMPAFFDRTRPTVAETIALIHDAGGVAVWAHPFWDVEDPAQVSALLERFADDGIDGVEAFYVTHDAAQTHHLDDAARRLNLLTTGSSDFHDPEHKLFSRFRAFDCFGREPRLGSKISGVGCA